MSGVNVYKYVCMEAWYLGSQQLHVLFILAILLVRDIYCNLSACIITICTCKLQERFSCIIIIICIHFYVVVF